jgi:hypothetical protein
MALLAAREEAGRLVANLLGMPFTEREKVLAISYVAVIRMTDGGLMQSRGLNGYALKYLIQNFHLWAPEALKLLEVDIEAAKLAADAEAAYFATQSWLLGRQSFTIMVGEPLSYEIKGNNVPGSADGPATTVPWTVIFSPPIDILIDLTTGTLSHNGLPPTAVGTYFATVVGESDLGIVTTTIEIVVLPQSGSGGNSIPSITAGQVFEFVVGGQYTSYNLQGFNLPGVSNGPNPATSPWSVTPALPDGILIDLTTGMIHGVATGPVGTFIVTVTGTGVLGTASQDITINVIP